MKTYWTSAFLLFAAGSLCYPTNNLMADEKSEPGSVTFFFDGGTLQCTFGRSNRADKPHVAMIVFPASVDRFSERSKLPIDKKQGGSIVLVSDANGKLIQLTSESLRAWSRARVSDMAGRQTSVAENAFVATVVHTISTGAPLEIWASTAQDILESGHWNKLFDPTLEKADTLGGDPFKK